MVWQSPSPRMLAALMTGALLLGGCSAAAPDSGSGAGSSDSTQVIDVVMRDVAFDPDVLELPAGETVELRFINEGQLVHDAFVGDPDEQQDHGAEMRGMDHGDGDATAVTVEPGTTATLTVTVAPGDALEIGCHQPGHYEAGMRLDLVAV